ncbi:MAG: efflux RND transporter periplasmic adaptor subunit, partial [Bryobacteraceae bacterium]
MVVLSFGLSGCGNTAGEAKASGQPQMPPASVGMVVAQPVPINESSEYVATLKSRNSTTISPQVDGQITQILVSSGDRVNAGTPMMQIDPLKQQATVGSQEAAHAAKVANVKYAEQQLVRTKNLAKEGVVSKQALDEAQAAYDAAEAELQSLEAQVQEQKVQLKYYRVVAPTSGIVGDIPVHVGDRVTPATVLTSVEQPGNLELYISVPVEKSSELALNKRVEVLDSNGAVAIPRGSRAQLVAVPNSDGKDTTLDLRSVTVNGQRHVLAMQSNPESSRPGGLGANARTGKYVGGGAAVGAVLGALMGGGKG